MNENEDVTLKLNAKEEWNANEEFDRLLMMNMDFPDKRLLMTNMKPCETAESHRSSQHDLHLHQTSWSRTRLRQ